MPLDRFAMQIGLGQKGESLVDSMVLGLMQRTITLETKVAELFDLLRESIYLYLMAVLRNPADAEDLTQESFLRLYRALHRGQRINNVRFWLFRVAHNLACDHRGKSQPNSTNSPTWEDLRQLLPDTGLNPEQRVLQMEKFERLHKAMAWLSPQEVQCLHLRAEGFRYREIGEILKIGEKTAAEYLRRGIGKLMRETNG